MEPAPQRNSIVARLSPEPIMSGLPSMTKLCELTATRQVLHLAQSPDGSTGVRGGGRDVAVLVHLSGRADVGGGRKGRCGTRVVGGGGIPIGRRARNCSTGRHRRDRPPTWPLGGRARPGTTVAPREEREPRPRPHPSIPTPRPARAGLFRLAGFFGLAPTAGSAAAGSGAGGAGGGARSSTTARPCRLRAADKN